MRGRVEIEFRCPSCWSLRLEAVQVSTVEKDGTIRPVHGHDREDDFICFGCGLTPVLPVPVDPGSGRRLDEFRLGGSGSTV
jgi:hypothetical protein